MVSNSLGKVNSPCSFAVLACDIGLAGYALRAINLLKQRLIISKILIRTTLRAVPIWALFVAMCSASNAALTWEKTELSIITPAGSTKADFTFFFKNSSANSIEIDELLSSCGCTSVLTDKRSYVPNEKGNLRGTFSVEGRFGLNTATISVKGSYIDRGIRRPFSDTLKLKVTITRLVGVTPGIALWRRGSETATKTIRFEVNQSLLLPLRLVTTENSHFDLKWTPIDEGKIYELKVTPFSTMDQAQVMVTAEGVDGDGKPVKFYAHLIIR